MSVQQFQKVDANKPAYHVQPYSGWLNDPNGPIYYKGQYHIFFQHVEDSADWQWRICWGHCVSKDLVHWQRLPNALLPSLNSQDTSGCWSGCCTTYNEQPYLIYTGVVLNNPEASKRIKCPQDEFVCLASLEQSQTTAEYKDLVRWIKNGVLIGEPPEELEQVYGWRDPFIFQNGGQNGQNWKMILGAGEYEKNGMILMYEADDLQGPWQFCGKILEKPISEVGSVCECPLLVKLPPYQTNHENNNSNNYKSNSLFLLAAGAYEYQKFHPEALSQPVFGWIGEFTDEQKFNIIDGPFKLDYGDAYYAATCQKGEFENEIILWAWMMETAERKNVQEKKQVQYDYSGCLGVPRIVLYDYDENQLVQLPHPKLVDLREQLLYNKEKISNDHDFGKNSNFLLNNGEFDMDQQQGWVTIDGNHLEVRLKLNFLNNSMNEFWEFLRIFGFYEEYQIVGGVNQRQFEFKLMRIGLNGEFELVKQMRLPFGQKELRGGILELIIFVDGSLIEMFTGSGKSLCTRLYCSSAEQRKINVCSEVIESCKVWKLKNNVIGF